MALVFLPKFAWILLLGPREAPDTDQYLGMAEELLGRREPGVSFPTVSYGLLYLGYPLFVAPLVALWGESPSLFELIGLAQTAVSAASVALLYRPLLMLTGKPGVALAVTAAYSLNPEILAWDRTLTTDSLSLSVMVLSGHFVLKALWSGRLNVGLLWLAVALIMRPTNLVYVSISLLALAGLGGFTKAARWAAAVVIVLAGIALLLRGRRFDMPVGSSFLAKAEAGVVIDDRPTYDVVSARFVDDPGALERAAVVAQVALKRMLLFWAPSLEGFSPRHTVLNVLTLCPLWMLAAVRACRLFRHGSDRVDRYLVALVLGYPIFHSLTMLDYDLRYRLSVLPFAHILAAQALAGRPGRTLPGGAVAF